MQVKISLWDKKKNKKIFINKFIKYTTNNKFAAAKKIPKIIQIGDILDNIEQVKMINKIKAFSIK